MLKNGINVIKKKKLHYIVEDGGRLFRSGESLHKAVKLGFDFKMSTLGIFFKQTECNIYP
jgi:hypothetical protein